MPTKMGCKRDKNVPRKRLRKVSAKQAIRNKVWSEVFKKRMADVGNVSEWSGLAGTPYDPLAPHHVIKRRYHDDSYGNCFICLWSENLRFEDENIDVRIYPTKESWENHKLGIDK